MTDKKLSLKTLKQIYWNWMFAGCSSQTGERMLGVGFAQAMSPAVEELYGDDQTEKVSALQRHMVLFNVESQVGAVVPGLTAAMEEQRANGAPIDDDMINTVKVALMGPLSGMGDTLIPGTLVPILLAIAIGITNASGMAGPLFYLLVYPLITILYSWYLFKLGYNAGLGGISKFMGAGTVDALTSALNILGLLVMGALGAGYVGVSTKLAFTSGELSVPIQGMLDGIMPKLLPLATIFGVYWLLSRKKKSPLFVMAVIFIVALVGVVLGVF
ncbi:PTS system mannose/fructose/sorbose family transporter subunit IID [Oscillospiraceae bacterium PP1C4]